MKHRRRPGLGRAFLGVLLWLVGVRVTSGAGVVSVGYDNTVTPLNVSLEGSGASELGGQIVLLTGVGGGLASVQSVAIEYFAAGLTGGETAKLRLYANDGDPVDPEACAAIPPLPVWAETTTPAAGGQVFAPVPSPGVLGYTMDGGEVLGAPTPATLSAGSDPTRFLGPSPLCRKPGTLLWESPAFGLRNGNIPVYVDDIDGAGPILVGQVVTWTLVIPTLPVGASLGLKAYNPPVTGYAPDDVWVRSGANWELRRWATGGGRPGCQVVIRSGWVPTLRRRAVEMANPIDAVVGTLSFGTGQAVPLVYALVAGEGDADNAGFHISGTELRVNDARLMTGGTHSVRVRAWVATEGLVERALSFGAPVPGVDTVHRLPGVGYKVPLARLLTNDTVDSGLTPTFVRADAVSNRGASVTVVGGWLYYAGESVTDSDTVAYVVGDGWLQTSGELRFVVDEPATSSLNLTVVGSEAGTRRFEALAIPGVTYRLQRAAGLAGPWTDVVAATAGASGKAQFTDPSPLPTAFYRLAVP